MTISFILNDEAVNDQTTGLQTGDSGDGFTDTDVTYASLPAAFRTYLETTLGLTSTFPTGVGVATKANSVTVNATAGAQITGVKFTDSAGGALDGDDSGLNTVDGKDILLFADGNDTVIGKYDSDGNGSADAIAFVIFKQEIINVGATSAQVTFHIVTYTPIFHGTSTDPDDAVDLGNTLRLAASEKLAFSFGGTPSGDHLFTMVQSGTTGLVATPETEVVKLHISQGGGPTTLGLFNQMIDPNETLVVTFLTNPNANFTVPNLSQGEADSETNILFGGLQTISGGSVTISQTQGNDAAGMRLTASIATGTTESTGNNFIAGYADDGISTISAIRVRDGSGTLLLSTTTDVTTPVNGITVDFRADGTVDVLGLEEDYTVEYDAGTHQRLKITGLAGKFDVGGIGVETPGSASAAVGQQIVIEDDGPGVSANATALLDDDALSGGNAGGTSDDTNAANTSGTLGHDFGTDGAGSIAFLTTGAPSGFTYQLSGNDLLVKQGATTVLTVTLNTTTGAYTVTQNNPILHATGLDENNQAFTIAYRVTDADGDTADGTLGVNVDDDTPTTSANLTALLDDDALTGGNAGGTGDDTNAANTSGTLGLSYGADGAGSIAFLTTGAPSGFTYQLSGNDLLVKQGVTTVLTVTLNTATGAYTVTQNNPILHATGLDENNQAFTIAYRVTDADGDTADGTLGVNVDDDTPTTSANLTALLDDDALTGGNAGGTGDDTNASNTSGTLGLSYGADGAGSIAFLTTGAPAGFTYQLSGNDLLVKQGTTTVLTVTLNTTTGAYTVTQNNQILHATGLDENNQAFTIAYRVTDADGDTADGTLGVNVDDDTPTTSANLTALLDDDALTGGNAGGTGDDTNASNTSGTLGLSYGADGAGSIAFLTTGAPAGFTYQLSGSDLLVKQGTTTVLTVTLNAVTGAYAVTQNNPILHATGLNENNQAFTIAYQVTDADGDTANGSLGINVDDDTPLIGPISDGLVDFADGDSVTNPLNGLVGADGPVTYSVTSSPATLTIFDGTTAETTLLRDISGNGTIVTYYDDVDGSGTLNAGDTSFFKLTVAGGNYTFEVLEDPPPAEVTFSFDGTPSGNHLFTMVQSDGSGIVATPETEVVKLHISQGGGPTTLGVFNQMIDPNETMMFTFLSNPNSNFTVPNLSQGEADLETNILFGDVKTITGGEVAISQTQGNDAAGMRLTAYNTKGDGSVAEPSGNGFINGYTNDPIAAISEVRIFDDNGTLLLTATGDVSTPVNGITVDFLASGEVEVRGFEDDYFIEYDAASHERLKVTGLEGKFDIGRIGISQTQPAPDEVLDFTVQISDADGDTASDSFAIGIDGTGIFDDNHVDGVIA
ncbi:beta strand repeat-containing protein [Aminobacter sp. Piv2-1]|uniref:beta strand repeat-containing protein n=1 Tax=Aminobacter sp. Piv2-1 TaxID=3031122 RepID=UPI0030AA8384